MEGIEYFPFVDLAMIGIKEPGSDNPCLKVARTHHRALSRHYCTFSRET